VEVVDRPPFQADRPLGDAFKPGDRVEQGRLAAARGADEHEEPALFELEIDALEDLDRAEALLEAGDLQEWHGVQHRG
jgi:hypothetical protein